ncbi:serine/threonine-protein kinase [Engelhardtia mirabilis]|uniref:Serine/threonine-protein kinase Pkn1 n=1 Tax=Engelhardtia mirabilis TaxID=2528011 RepID=A0A518BH78_9BACT|nr:Serine/threonine-protein kinase Pkn1 [Planctomycetes bacterium Pla133]QDV00665.1 Serine/threonine-protein kinase Pkn1 [Planctomycetes bacterium Pla86]
MHDSPRPDGIGDSDAGRDPIRAARSEAEQGGVEPPAPAAIGERAGDTIDRYKLLQELGEGGMGTVWMAEQREPVVRRVALKIIKLGMDTREVVVRFEAERQALALMDHPHIAKVLDGGATRSGRPYFVMELVKGTPITEYCDTARAGLRERLELFVKVCEAVQHAHQKGVIHRDLKPGNVLVTLHDGVPVPKVIDFGIAKATSAELTQKTMFTQHAQMLGTPEYMAPEQAELSGLDIDTRADVYSLGVLLYELLTGTRPFDIREVLERGFDELLRTIREDDPERPSTRVSTMGAKASPVAAGRQVNVENLSKRLRGDLDWVVMKALEKDRNRRYESASGFGADVARFLRDEPVLAAPPGGVYRLRKFVRRRKKTVVAVTTIAFLLVGGSIGTGVGWWNTQRANEALSEALEAKDDALAEKDDALAEEERQRGLAQESAARAREAEQEALARADELERVTAFQSSQLAELDVALMGIRLRRSLLDAVPDDQREALSAGLAPVNFSTIALRALEQNLFERTVEAIDAQFATQPLIRARLLATLVSTLQALGLPEAAGAPARRALDIRRAELGDAHPATLESLYQLGRQLYDEGRFEEAETALRGALDGLRRLHGDDQLETLGPLVNLGNVLQAQGRYDEAVLLFEEVAEVRRRLLGDEDPQTARSVDILGTLLRSVGRLDEAEPLLREALDVRRRQLGDEHRDTLSSFLHLGGLLQAQGHLDLAEPYFQQALDGRRRLLGDEHPETLKAINNLGGLYHAQGRLDLAEAHFREAMEGWRRILGDEHPQTLKAMNNVGAVLGPLGRLEESEVLLRQALEGWRHTLGDDHPDTLLAIDNFGYLMEQQGRLDEADPFYREAIEGRRRALGDDHPHTLASITNLAFLRQAQGRLEEAEPLYREALEGRRRVLGEEHPKTLASIHYLAVLYEAQGRLDLAETYYREAIDGRRRVLGDEHPQTLESIRRLTELDERR